MQPDCCCMLNDVLKVRATNLQELVYKNGQAGVTKATVSIEFDNSNKQQSPMGYEIYDEITVSRQVMLEFFAVLFAFLIPAVCLLIENIIVCNAYLTLSGRIFVYFFSLHVLWPFVLHAGQGCKSCMLRYAFSSFWHYGAQHFVHLVFYNSFCA